MIFRPKLIFLDIDGVLNTHQFSKEAKSNVIERDKMELLNIILRKTGAYVVLSSAWRYLIHRGEMNFMGMEWLLRSHGMVAERFLGITDPDRMMPFWDRGIIWEGKNERGKQIMDYLLELAGEPFPRYVVLDDGGTDEFTGGFTDLGLNDAGHPVVWTDPNVGLTQEHVEKAIEILNKI